MYLLHSQFKDQIGLSNHVAVFLLSGLNCSENSEETKWSQRKHPLFVYQGHSIQTGHQRCWRRTTVFLRGATTSTAGRSGQNLPPQMTTPTVWPGSTTLTWTPPGKSPPDLSGLCSPARKVWRRATTLRFFFTWEGFRSDVLLSVGFPLCMPRQVKLISNLLATASPHKKKTGKLHNTPSPSAFND